MLPVMRVSWSSLRLLLAIVLLILAGHDYFLNTIVHVRYYLRPVWPHGYHRYFPHADLLDNIHSQFNMVQPKTFTLSKTVKTDGNRIPKVVHLMWKDENVPRKLVPWLKRWSETNPDWTVLFWTDESMTRFVNQYYKDLALVYNSLKVPVMRADMFRYLLLLSIGGVWADLDVEPLKSLNPVREWSSCVVSQEPPEHHQISSYFAFGRYSKNNYTLACNAVMACRPGHPFMFFLLSTLTERSPLINRFSCPLNYALWCTGPELLTQTYMFYKWSLEKRQTGTSTSDDVIMTRPDVFLPTFDTDKNTLYEIRKNCESGHLGEIGKRLCVELSARNFTNRPIPLTSLTNHQWFHSYYLGKNYPIDHIKKVLPNVKFFFDDFSD